MDQPTRDKFRALFPEIKDDNLDAAQERLRRYFSVVVDISRSDLRKLQPLTELGAAGNVDAGEVDPSTYSTQIG